MNKPLGSILTVESVSVLSECVVTVQVVNLQHLARVQHLKGKALFTERM